MENEDHDSYLSERFEFVISFFESKYKSDLQVKIKSFHSIYIKLKGNSVDGSSKKFERIYEKTERKPMILPFYYF